MTPKLCAMPSDNVGFDPELIERKAYVNNCEERNGLMVLQNLEVQILSVLCTRRWGEDL